MDAICDYLLKAGILLDSDGDPDTQRPDFAPYYSNGYLPGGQ
jgi:hypothetical protein